MIVNIWKLKHGVSRQLAIRSLRDCAEGSIDVSEAENYVTEICTRADVDASAANAYPMGFRIKLRNPLSDICLSKFRGCFHFNTEDEPDDSTQLKLFRVMVDYDQFYTVLVLATDEERAITSARDELAERGSDLNYEVNQKSVSCEARELTNFKNGSVLSVVTDISVVPSY